MKKISLNIPYSEVILKFSRSGGAGGQNVNKVNSKVTLRWNFEESNFINADTKARIRIAEKNRINSENELLINSEVSRDQPKNIEDCYQKLQEIIAKARIRPKKRIATKPKRSSIEKRIQTKTKRKLTKASRQKIKDY